MTSQWAIDLKNYRQRIGLTQAALASLVRVNVQTVSRWERGESEPDLATQAQVRRLMLSQDITVFRARVENSPLYEILRTVGGQDAVVVAVSEPYCKFHGLPGPSFVRDKRVQETIEMSTQPERFSDFRDRLLVSRNQIVNDHVNDIAFVSGSTHVRDAAGNLWLAKWIAVPTLVGGTMLMHNAMNWEPCPDPKPADEIKITWLADL